MCLHICVLPKDLKNILPITTAKVPIVKFFHIRTALEGDISLYNTLVRTSKCSSSFDLFSSSLISVNIPDAEISLYNKRCSSLLS